MSHRIDVERILTEAGGKPLTAAEVAPLAGITLRQSAQTLNALRQDRKRSGIVRLDRSTYAWRPGRLSDDVAPGMGRPAARAAHSEELAEVGRLLDDEMFRKAGLEVAGRTAAGDRIAFDEEGTAWILSVEITARIL